MIHFFKIVDVITNAPSLKLIINNPLFTSKLYVVLQIALKFGILSFTLSINNYRAINQCLRVSSDASQFTAHIHFILKLSQSHSTCMYMNCGGINRVANSFRQQLIDLF